MVKSVQCTMSTVGRLEHVILVMFFGHSGSNCPSKKHEKPEKNRYKHDSFKIKKPYVNQKQKFREKACMPKPAFKKGSTSGVNVQENSEVCSSGAMVSFCVAEIDHCQWALIPFS